MNEYLIFKDKIINGHKISYFYTDTNSKTIIIFLHGWGLRKESFSYIYNSNTINGFDVAGFDFPAFGNSSDISTVMKLSDFTDVAVKFIEHIRNGKRVILVGHSFGGRVILKISTIKTDLLKYTDKIIFVGTPFYRNKEFKIIRYLFDIASRIFNTDSKISIISRASKIIKSFVKKTIGSVDYIELGDNEVMKKTFQNIIYENISDNIKNFYNKNVHIIWGKNDDVVPVKYAEMAKTITGGKLIIIKDAGHTPFVDKPKEFNSVFNKILNN